MMGALAFEVKVGCHNVTIGSAIWQDRRQRGQPSG